MSPIELLEEPRDGQLETSSTKLAEHLFDEVIVPLARTEDPGPRGRLQGAPWRAAGASSFFSRSSIARMAPADFVFPGGGTGDGLVDALADRWAAEDETGLVAAVPRLRQLVESLRDEVGNDDGSVDIFCYTLF